MLELNRIYQGDCLILSDEIESGSIDLILTDLPYGNMNGAGLDGWENNKTSWDFAIEPKNVFEIANRILRKNGKMILFSQEPYTNKLINEAIPNIPFSYRMIWEKDHFANSLIAKKSPVSYYEDILVFSKKYDFEGIHPLRPYFENILNFIGLNKKRIVETIGQGADHCFRVDSSQFTLCTETTYNKLIEIYKIDKMIGFKTFTEISEESDGLLSVFNLWDGKRYKSNILKYKKDYNGYHPTQKPVLLMEDLVRTFSNEDDLVVDLTAGSGSTIVACINSNRNFIGMELEPKYVEIANKRITNFSKQEQLI